MNSRWLKTAAAILATALCASLSAARAQGEAPRLTVLTFNVWGIIGAKERPVRMEAIGRKVASLNPDVIALEEAFEGRHRRILMNSLRKNGYKIADWRYFRNEYGSGLLFITKFKIAEADFQPYRVLGGPRDIEWLGGKGVAYLKLVTPWGPLDFFHTHAIARMTAIFDAQGNYIPHDPKEVDRLLNMYQIDKFVRSHRSDFARSFIFAGDFNVSPEMLEYPFLLSLTGFQSSFEVLHPGENPSTFSKEDVWVKDDFSRIDHIFYKNFEGADGFWVKPVESRLTMNERFTNPRNKKEINYSDHYGLLTVFEVVTKDGEVEPSPDGITPSGRWCNDCPIRGYEGGRINLTADNDEQWRDLALREFATSYRKQERRNRLLVPLAEVVSARPPATIEVPDENRKALEALLQ